MPVRCLSAGRNGMRKPQGARIPFDLFSELGLILPHAKNKTAECLPIQPARCRSHPNNQMSPIDCVRKDYPKLHTSAQHPKLLCVALIVVQLVPSFAVPFGFVACDVLSPLCRLQNDGGPSEPLVRPCRGPQGCWDWHHRGHQNGLVLPQVRQGFQTDISCHMHAPASLIWTASFFPSLHHHTSRAGLPFTCAQLSPLPLAAIRIIAQRRCACSTPCKRNQTRTANKTFQLCVHPGVYPGECTLTSLASLAQRKPRCASSQMFRHNGIP